MEIKKKFKGCTMSNGNIKFNTDDIKEDMVPFYIKQGFGYIFVEKKKSKKVEKVSEENKEDK